MVPPAPDGAPRDGDEDPAAGAGADGGERVADGQETTGERRVTPGPARSALREYLDGSASAAGRLPSVLSQLEAENRATRLQAATVCCLVAVEAGDEDIVEYLVSRMSDRLSDGEGSVELTTALEYLAAAFPEQAAPVLADLEGDDQAVLPPERSRLTGSDHYRQVGRVGVAGDRTGEDPQHIIAGSQHGERERTLRERRRRERDDETAAGRDEREEDTGEERDRASQDASGESGDAGRTDPGVETPDISGIALRSRFDELHFQGERHRGRYETTYEALVSEGGVKRAVALRLLHRPDPPDAVPEFDRGLAVSLQRWQSVSDHEHVVRVIDWGIESRPWLASSLTEESLAARDRPTLPIAFENALALADAVSHLHRQDVVHGGLDPRSVVYPGEQFGDDDNPRGPLLNNVGLLTVLRHYFQPADCLDPRYAAPEYYDTRFGQIDHATDIYQLGAVCYRLFTGRPPYTGGFDAVREAVLDRTPPAPSSVADTVPTALDDLLAKAMATQKLRRYETIQQFRGELATLVDEYA